MATEEVRVMEQSNRRIQHGTLPRSSYSLPSQSYVKMDTTAITDAIRSGEVAPEEAVRQSEIRMGSRVYRAKTKDQRLESYRESRALRNKILANRIPFICKDFLPHFFLCQGLIVVGGESGRAKSTTCANMLAGFIRECPGKKALVISTEEATDAVYERVACILLKESYQAFYTGQLPNDAMRAIERTVESIIPSIEVIVEEDMWDPSYIEDVEAILETAAYDGVNLVLVDYLQTITGSRKDDSMESFQVSKKLGMYLKDYGRKHGVPVVVFAQLNPSTHAPTMASRIQNDKTFFNHGFICIEIKPDFETLTTEFTIHKDRFFGMTGKKVVMDFITGRYELSRGL
jgi:hypothetical protein